MRTLLGELALPKLGTLVRLRGRLKFVTGLQQGEGDWVALRDLRTGLASFLSLREYLRAAEEAVA